MNRDHVNEIVIVPHTHWDREWYEPHDVFRLRLVHMLDGLLDTLDAEPAYRFTLDGQTAAVLDFLEIRPEQTERVRAAVQRGQLAVGPFLILTDEFLCDGETLIRNLELGIRAARRFGPEMRLGYLPDMFGHAAQTPQLLRGFGIRDAMLWRGVPARIDRHAFAWAAPDGSTVRTEYLFDGYGNALDLFALPGQLGTLAPEYLERVADWFGDDPVLGMLGTDHSAPPADLLDTIAAYSREPGAVAMPVDTAEGYVRRVAGDWTAGGPGADAALAALPRIDGELRAAVRGNILPGVFSIRTNVKQAMSDAERDLALAERLDAAFGVDDHFAFFDTAWGRVVESAAHDSVTGCGVDATADEVAERLATASHIARGVVLRTMGRLAASVDAARHVVVNPAGFTRRGHVELLLQNPDPARLGDGVQLLGELPTVLGDETMTSEELPKLLMRIHGRELFGQLINAWAFSETGLRFDVAEAPVGDFDLAAFTAELRERIAAAPGREWRVEIVAAPRSRALVGVDLAGLGAAELDPATARSAGDPVAVGPRSLANARLSATVADDGTVRLESADGTVFDGVLALVDDGDRGDSYNYGPVAPGQQVTAPASVEIEVLEAGPVRGRIRIRRAYELPVGLGAADRDRRAAETAPCVVDTVIELREGEPMLRVEIDVVNPVPDHRLRVLVPTGGADAVALDRSEAAGQYGVTRRGRLGEGGGGEFPLPTYPAARFVHAGAATVLVAKHTEFELVSEDGRPDVLALTLLRAVGMMSVNVHPLRDEPAGAEFPVPGAQYLGTRVRTRLAVLPSSAGWADAEAPRWSEVFRFEPQLVRGTAGGPAVVGGVAGAGGAIGAGGPLPAEPVIAAGGDVVLESLRRVDAAGGHDLEARFVNYRDAPAPLAARATGVWDRTDLAGSVVEAAIDLNAFTVGAARIETFRRRAG